MFTGAHGIFSSGGALRAMPPAPKAAAHARLDTYAKLICALHTTPLPVVAAVEGVAVGITVGIARNCDIIVASSESTFLMPLSRLGLFPDGGLTYGFA